MKWTAQALPAYLTRWWEQRRTQADAEAAEHLAAIRPPDHAGRDPYQQEGTA
ncbi:hypothetical protein ABT340_39255 [Streptosporangium sp. NPDC000239]|uniref:hypothetical protein n=1 Tax=Streptosporangium sp. NPDC000239 TaxID=3154248 RepID=UPI00332FEB92